jgi:hypothetical protein
MAKIAKHEGLIDVCDILFSQVEKPKRFKMCKAINVYDNKYRINVYTHEVINDLDSQRISRSYFARLNDDDSLEILMGNEPAETDTNKKKYKLN